MKHFVISNDKEIVQKTLKTIEKIYQKDKKLTLCKLKFSMNAYTRLKENEIKKFSESAQDLFRLIHSFGKNEELTNFANVWMFEDPRQMPKTMICGPFQIYFYENIFFSTKTAKVKATRNWQTTPLRHCLTNFFRLTKKETNNC